MGVTSDKTYWVKETIWFWIVTPSGNSFGLMQSVAPSAIACTNFCEFRSIAKILRAPRCLAAWITANPTAPKPNTATVASFSTLQVFQTAPRPVETPHPKRQTLSKGDDWSILAQEISLTTVYSEKVEVPMKWKISRPSSVVNLVVPSGITPRPCVLRIAGQRLVFGDWQKMQVDCRHSGV